MKNFDWGFELAFAFATGLVLWAFTSTVEEKQKEPAVEVLERVESAVNALQMSEHGAQGIDRDNLDNYSYLVGTIQRGVQDMQTQRHESDLFVAAMTSHIAHSLEKHEQSLQKSIHQSAKSDAGLNFFDRLAELAQTTPGHIRHILSQVVGSVPVTDEISKKLIVDFNDEFMGEWRNQTPEKTEELVDQVVAETVQAQRSKRAPNTVSVKSKEAGLPVFMAMTKVHVFDHLRFAYRTGKDGFVNDGSWTLFRMPVPKNPTGTVRVTYNTRSEYDNPNTHLVVRVGTVRAGAPMLTDYFTGEPDMTPIGPTKVISQRRQGAKTYRQNPQYWEDTSTWFLYIYDIAHVAQTVQIAFVNGTLPSNALKEAELGPSWREVRPDSFLDDGHGPQLHFMNYSSFVGETQHAK